MQKTLDIIKKFIPKSVFSFFQPAYHFLLSILGVLINRFPAKNLIVIGVTGTKGKSTTTEILNAIFEEAGFKTALQNTLRFKIGDKEERNLYKMSMPGRFFIQNFLRKAADAKCEVAIMELTSEGAKQYRHKYINLRALVFTNLAKEHIESHGSYENYREAKLSIARELENKKGRAIFVNNDDVEADKFLALDIDRKVPYSIKDVIGIKADSEGSSFQIEKVVIHSKLPGLFNVYNIIGAIKCAEFFGISVEMAKKAVEKIGQIRGRMEKVKVDEAELGFDVVVDYAHTKDSLEAVYTAYKDHKKVCLLGNTGGGRDTWKRPEMGKVADMHCDYIILTNEDPYDEDPKKIIEEVKAGISHKPVEVIMDRRKAIRNAIKKAQEIKSQKSNQDVAVLITGKGTDPYIMEANGKKTPWDDATVTREEISKIFKIKQT